MISFIVCSNGYGHITRVISVVESIFSLNNDIAINVFCSERNIAFAKENLCTPNNFKRIVFSSELSFAEPDWTANKKIEFEEYVFFSQLIGKSELLKNSTLIVSDNLVAPLAFFPNTILLGSFLWFDVLRAHPYFDNRIIKFEEKLIKEKQVTMIAVKNIVMNSVLEFTKPKLVPWFFSEALRLSNTAEEKTDVLFSGGGTSLMKNIFQNMITEIADKVDYYKLLVDKNLFSSDEKGIKKYQLFDFTDEAFLKLKAIVCRPGIGVITTAIKNVVPIIAIDDGSNSEISHNAKCIEELGLGMYIRVSGLKDWEIAEKVLEILRNDNLLKSFEANIISQESGGALSSAKFILESYKFVS